MGTASITNTSVTGSSHHNLFLDNSSGTLTSLTITGSTFNSAVGGNGILFRAITTAAVTSVSVTGSTFSDNQVTGMQVVAQDSATISDFTLSGNTFTDANAGDGLNQEIGMDFNTAGTGNLTFKALNNTLTRHNSHAMNIATGAGAGTGGTHHGQYHRQRRRGQLGVGDRKWHSRQRQWRCYQEHSGRRKYHPPDAQRPWH